MRPVAIIPNDCHFGTGPVMPIRQVMAPPNLSTSLNGSHVMRFLSALLLVAIVAFHVDSARAGSCTSACKPSCNGIAVECNFSCRPVCSQETISHDYFEVECEYICIPGIKFPWQDCCEPPKCGKVRRVRRLTTGSYDCGTRTVWDWEVVSHCRRIDCTPLGCRGAAAPGCCAPMQ